MRCLINAGNACVLGQRRLPCYDVLLYRVCHCCSIFQPPSPFIFERYSRRLERTRATCADKRHEKWTWRDEGKWYEVWLTPNFVARTFRRRNIKHRYFSFFMYNDFRGFSHKESVSKKTRSKYTFRGYPIESSVATKVLKRCYRECKLMRDSLARNDFTLLIGSSIFLWEHATTSCSSVVRASEDGPLQ